MTDIYCAVENCRYNSSGACGAERIRVMGTVDHPEKTDLVNCMTFRDEGNPHQYENTEAVEKY